MAYNRRYTGTVTAPIKPNQVFVFSSYSNGVNKAGTAKAAYTYFGARAGQGEGFSGHSYAIPSEVPLDQMSQAVNSFIEFAKTHPELEFLVTPIGVGRIFKRDKVEMARLFVDAIPVENIILPKEFADILNQESPKQDIGDTEIRHKRKIDIIVEDITKLKVDAIVNAANQSLLGGGGIDGMIHQAAGPGLLIECQKLGGCSVGSSKMTDAYNLPCKKIIHTVGPDMRIIQDIREGGLLLRSCYRSVLDIASKNNLKSVAFCCISTGIYRFPKDEAAKIALNEISLHPYRGDVLICCYTEEDKAYYDKALATDPDSKPTVATVTDDFPIKHLSAEKFLDFFPIKMEDDEKKMLAAKVNDSEDAKRFKSILKSIDRDGTSNLLRLLRVNGFFSAPASIVHHSNWEGGLVNHSLKVYDNAMRIRQEMMSKDPSLSDQLAEDSVAIAALLHDVCKMDEYGINADGSPRHKDPLYHLSGHGSKSVIMILSQGYKLYWPEIIAIRWHMGSKRIQDSKEKAECEKAKKEYALVRLIIQADHEAATKAG